jgi:hypothetical protein
VYFLEIFSKSLIFCATGRRNEELNDKHMHVGARGQGL